MMAIEVRIYSLADWAELIMTETAVVEPIAAFYYQMVVHRPYPYSQSIAIGCLRVPGVPKLY